MMFVYMEVWEEVVADHQENCEILDEIRALVKDSSHCQLMAVYKVVGVVLHLIDWMYL